MSKFADVPVEDDTNVIGERELKVGEYDALYLGLDDELCGELKLNLHQLWTNVRRANSLP